jgi:hypothetical protein
LDDDGKVVLVRRLLKEGLLTRVGDETAAGASRVVDTGRAAPPQKHRALKEDAAVHA